MHPALKALHDIISLPTQQMREEALKEWEHTRIGRLRVLRELDAYALKMAVDPDTLVGLVEKRAREDLAESIPCNMEVTASISEKDGCLVKRYIFEVLTLRL